MGEVSTCRQCKEEKELSEFGSYRYKRKDGTISVNSWCKACSAKARREHRATNREHYKQLNLKSHIKVGKTKAKQTRLVNREKYIWMSARARAKEKSIPFNIEISDIVIPQVCPLLETPIVRDVIDRTNMHVPSLDKIIPSLGYVKGNVRVISFKANMVKNDLTEEQLMTFAKNISTYFNEHRNGKSKEV